MKAADALACMAQVQCALAPTNGRLTASNVAACLVDTVEDMGQACGAMTQAAVSYAGCGIWPVEAFFEQSPGKLSSVIATNDLGGPVNDAHNPRITVTPRHP
jgi:hypothetical protein